MDQHLPTSLRSWCRQGDTAREKIVTDQVFQISKISPGEEPLVIASCGKQSAQRLIAALSTEDGPARYRVSAIFVNPCLPGLQPPVIPQWYIEQQAQREFQALRQGIEH